MNTFGRQCFLWGLCPALLFASLPALSAPETLTCQVGNSASVAPEVIRIDDADQSVNIIEGSTGGIISVSRYDADAIAFKDSFDSGDKLFMQIDRVTGRFTFEYENADGQVIGGVTVGQCTKSGQ